MTLNEIRDEFADKLRRKEFVILPGGVKTIEIQGAYFEASEPAILGKPNDDYIARELEWYLSMSRNVNDIPGDTPAIWKKCATPEGLINSNYGWMVFSKQNGDQYSHVCTELNRDPSSRRAVVIYTRPTMHVDQSAGGMQDFACTNTVQYLNRYGVLNAYVNMRSNDAVFGYANDYAWQKFVLDSLAKDLDLEVGKIMWFAGSLHFYERHFHLVEEWDSAIHAL